MVSEPHRTDEEAGGLPADVQADSPDRAPSWLTALVLGLLGSLALLLHSPSYLLSHPFWVDESWVAVASKAPLGRLLTVTSSTPLGWTLLMLIVPGTGEQRYRLLPLAFAAGSIMVAFLFARDLGWNRRRDGYIAGLGAAIAAAVVPVALLRNDLKQYTGDAFFALLLVWLVVRLEQQWSRSRLVTLVVASIAAGFVSTASLFVTAALFISLVVVSIWKRRRDRIVESLIATGAAGLGTLAAALVFVLPNTNDSLSEYWADWFVPTDRGLTEVAQVAWERFENLAPLMGFGWAAALAVAIVVGVGAIALRGRPAAAMAIPVLWLEMIVLGLLERYPFLDQRTSHFLLVLSIVVAAIGIVDVAIRLASVRQVVGVIILVGVAGAYFSGVSQYVGTQSILPEDVRSQVRYIEAHQSPGDTILISVMGGWGFAYYWDLDDPVFYETTAFATGFGVEYERDDIMVASGRTVDTVSESLEQAIEQASSAGSNGRIWLVRTHLNRTEKAAWAEVLDRMSIPFEVIDTGTEPLTLIDTSGV